MLAPSEAERARLRSSFELVQRVLASQWPHARVHLFGECGPSTLGKGQRKGRACVLCEEGRSTCPRRSGPTHACTSLVGRPDCGV